ncbi:AraC family transcriptional regulator [Yoonia sediminilitoris]|uniref:AraC family transcriptional regulator n=1 Tax=Yoonia sediminilitoris TaxID=1286148 RepID=A0A2T6KM90_9RHOB|nr:AraC family transcriptional regulator [Yoonia sediminilitoris]PUB17330.1 AraC family transcriptional regulator [Yoonia sediminilitoris]RCW97625.1 AraC family transcriptional regulator [Yoonia sediminilitoris]
MTEQTMAAGFAAAFADYACDRGANRDALLADSGLTDDVLSDQDNRIPVAAYQALIGAAIRQTGDTALLLRHTLESRLETMSVVGQIVHTSASLGHSIAQLNRYLHLMADVNLPAGTDRFALLHTDAGLWIVDHLVVPHDAYMGIEGAFARFISEFRRSFPGATFEIGMEVTYPPPPHADQYPDLFRVPVQFNANRNALQIDPVWDSPDTQFEPGNEYAFGIFTRHADKMLAKLRADTSIRAQIEAQILPKLHEGTISMDKVAKDTAMSRQTLYRRLKDEGITFAEIHDDLRQRMAMEYLGGQKVTVNETAYLLGFSEASSFVRAFKRWTGLSPTAYLNQAA